MPNRVIFQSLYFSSSLVAAPLRKDFFACEMSNRTECFFADTPAAGLPSRQNKITRGVMIHSAYDSTIHNTGMILTYFQSNENEFNSNIRFENI